MKMLIIIGAGGHGKSVEWVARSTKRWNKIVFLDSKIVSSKVVGTFEDRIKFKNEDFFVAIGDNLKRKSLTIQLIQEGFNVVSIVAPNSDITNAKIGIGSIIMNHAFINVDSVIGDGCIINNAVLVEHDCKIGSYSHLSPSVNVAGTTQIGELTWIGIGSSIINNIKIEQEIVIGARSVVVDNLIEKGTYVGIPAKRINKL
jgi:sugar O-acyltransferase (sialic acid O-acetyltransferase NeuD family)